MVYSSTHSVGCDVPSLWGYLQNVMLTVHVQSKAHAYI